MSKKLDYVKDSYYRRHLYGDAGVFNSAPNTSRVAIIQRMYMRILTELATNRFKWLGMPESIDIRFMEMTLFYRALSVFYFDQEFGRFFALKGGGTGNTNMLDNPTKFQVTGNEFVGKTLDAKDCVPIWANYLRAPDLDIVMIYATKFAELDTTIEINSKSARRNKVIVANENQRLSATNINRQLDNGDSVIHVNQPLGDMITAVDLGINPLSIETLHILKARLWNECMTLLGIDNSNQDKKERLVAAEVGANDDQVSSTRAVNLNARRKAADDINRKYGLNVSVEYHTDGQRELEFMDYENYSLTPSHDTETQE